MTKRILIAILDFYRCWLSPAMHVLSPWGCRYRPTCSEYAVEAVTLHGAAKGAWMALRRLLRCHPLARSSSFDPVPLPQPVPSAGDACGVCIPPPAIQSLHDPLP